MITVPLRLVHDLAETVSTHVDMSDPNVQEAVDLLRAFRVDGAASETCRECRAAIFQRGYSWVDDDGRTAHLNGRAGEAEWEPHRPSLKADAP